MAGHTAVQASTGWCFKVLCRDFNLQVGWENSNTVQYFQEHETPSLKLNFTGVT